MIWVFYQSIKKNKEHLITFFDFDFDFEFFSYISYRPPANGIFMRSTVTHKIATNAFLGRAPRKIIRREPNYIHLLAPRRLRLSLFMSLCFLSLKCSESNQISPFYSFGSIPTPSQCSLFSFYPCPLFRSDYSSLSVDSLFYHYKMESTRTT